MNATLDSAIAYMEKGLRRYQYWNISSHPRTSILFSPPGPLKFVYQKALSLSEHLTRFFLSLVS
jgi:hypothetical protein